MPRTVTDLDAAVVADSLLDRDPRPPDEVEAAILAAGRAEALAVGFGQVSLEGVAARAGIARSTVYRRIGSRNALLSAIVADQARFVLDALASFVATPAGSDPAPLADRVVRAFRAGAIAAERLGLPDMLRTEPLLLHLVTVEGGPVLDAARDRLTNLLAADPAMSDSPDVAIVADALLRLAVSVVTLPPTSIDWTDEATLHRVLGPMIRPLTGQATGASPPAQSSTSTWAPSTR